MAAQDGLGDKKVKLLPGVIGSFSNDAEFFPSLPKSSALTFIVNDEPAAGRPAGALGWAGLPDLFYSIDRQNGVGGFSATRSALSRPGVVRWLHRVRDRGVRQLRGAEGGVRLLRERLQLCGHLPAAALSARALGGAPARSASIVLTSLQEKIQNTDQASAAQCVRTIESDEL